MTSGDPPKSALTRPCHECFAYPGFADATPTAPCPKCGSSALLDVLVHGYGEGGGPDLSGGQGA